MLTNTSLKDSLFSDFARRLTEACDQSPKVPPIHQGRQTFFAREFERRGIKLSKESVRRWFAGASRPRIEKMRILSEILAVDESWLALGMKSGIPQETKKAINSQTNSVANLVGGALGFMGVNCAFSEIGQAEDFHVIWKGKHLVFKCYPIIERESKMLIHIHNEFERMTNIAVIANAPFNFSFFIVPNDLITSHGVKRGGYIELECSTGNQNVKIGDRTIRPITSLDDIS